jgi:hypothetical protein
MVLYFYDFAVLLSKQHYLLFVIILSRSSSYSLLIMLTLIHYFPFSFVCSSQLLVSKYILTLHIFFLVKTLIDITILYYRSYNNIFVCQKSNCSKRCWFCWPRNVIDNSDCEQLHWWLVSRENNVYDFVIILWKRNRTRKNWSKHKNSIKKIREN